jgi:hypothetical protein
MVRRIWYSTRVYEFHRVDLNVARVGLIILSMGHRVAQVLSTQCLYSSQEYSTQAEGLIFPTGVQALGYSYGFPTGRGFGIPNRASFGLCQEGFPMSGQRVSSQSVSDISHREGSSFFNGRRGP